MFLLLAAKDTLYLSTADDRPCSLRFCGHFMYHSNCCWPTQRISLHDRTGLLCRHTDSQFGDQAA